MASLFAQTQAKDSLVEFRAGVLQKDKDTKWVRADARKGTVVLKRSGEDQLIHFIWKTRPSGSTELDLIIFPDDATFRRVKECTTGRVYVLEFKTGTKNFFWMQEPSTDKDDEYCKSINDYINNKVDGSGSSPGFQQFLSQATGSSSVASNYLERTQASSPSLRNLQGSSTTAASTQTDSSKPASGSDSNTLQTRLDSVLSGFGSSSGPQPRLNDVIATQDVLQTGILNDSAVLEELQKHLPESEQDSVKDTLRSPQFRQAVDTLNGILQHSPGALNTLLAQFGIQHPAQPGSSRLETFLKAITEQAKKEASSKKPEEEEKSDDKMQE